MDEVSNIIKESIENTIGGNGYAHAKVSQWTNAVVESCLASLTKLQKPFKYIGKLSKKLMEKSRRDFLYFFSVTCVIMQKNGAGLHTASSCYWDNSTDGSCTVRWENKTMYCIVSVFGLAIWNVWKWRSNAFLNKVWVFKSESQRIVSLGSKFYLMTNSSKFIFYIFKQTLVQTIIMTNCICQGNTHEHWCNLCNYIFSVTVLPWQHFLVWRLLF